MNPFAWFKKKEPELDENGKPLPPPSKGEIWYDRILYTGINYWLNLGISLVITDFFVHGKGKGFFENGVKNATGALMKTGMKKPLAKWLAGVGLGTFSLNSGGNILLIPTKFVEDKKREWVYWLNEKLGVDQTAPDGHKEAPDEIYIAKEQDPQSWARMIGRRFLGWCASTSTGLTLDWALAKKLPVPKMIDGELVTKKYGQDVYTDWTKSGVNHVLNKMGGEALVKNDAVQRYMGYAALDWIYTIMTSGILHATNGAHKKHMPHEIDNQETSQLAQTEEKHDTTIVPASKHVAEIIRNKDKDAGFAHTVSREENSPSLQVGA